VEPVVLEITDDGTGIPAAEREKVFERFFRIDQARSRAEGGIGLGLAIARWEGVANGGQIELRDHGRPGACCRITLPARGGVPATAFFARLAHGSCRIATGWRGCRSPAGCPATARIACRG